MRTDTINTFLNAIATTAMTMDLVAQMDLISHRVQVFGIPGFDVINYDDWAAQCQHEFEADLIQSVSYQGLHIITAMPDSIMFKMIETVEATDNTRNVMGIEVILEKKSDGKWCITQERVLSDDELQHDKRKGLL